MPPPSALAIKTSAVVRLVKEEGSYHKEQIQQASRLEKLLADENADEYEIKQQKTVVEQTKDVVPAVREKLTAAIEALEHALENEDEESEETKEKAKKAIEDGKKVLES